MPCLGFDVVRPSGLLCLHRVGWLRCALLVVLGGIAAPGRAQTTGGQALFTEDGVEVGVDARVATLFSMLNAIGYDDDTVRGPPPLHRPQYTEARQRARQNIGRPGPSLQAFDATLAREPRDIGAYVAAVLELGPAPGFDAEQAGELAKAIAVPMREWFNEEGGGQVVRLVADAGRTTQKELLSRLDQSTKAMTQLIRLGGAEDQLLDESGAQGRAVLSLNELDTHGTLQRVEQAGVITLIAGPSANDTQRDTALDAVVAAYAETLVARDVSRSALAGTLGGDDKGYTMALLACAFTRHVRGPTAECSSPALRARPESAAHLTALAPRVASYAQGTELFAAALPAMLAPTLPSATTPGARGDGKKQKNDAKPGTKSGVTQDAAKAGGKGA